jgi:hypothetical protein
VSEALRWNHLINTGVRVCSHARLMLLMIRLLIDCLRLISYSTRIRILDKAWRWICFIRGAILLGMRRVRLVMVSISHGVSRRLRYDLLLHRWHLVLVIYGLLSYALLNLVSISCVESNVTHINLSRCVC